MTRPSAKMLRECAAILETAPYARTQTAEWLREQADQQDDVDKAIRAVRVGLLRMLNGGRP